MAAKFHERFEIEISLEDARRRFVNRTHRLVFYEFWMHLGDPNRRQSLEEVAFELGDELRGDLLQLVGSDFFRNVQALDALYQFISDIDKQKNLENLIHRLLDASEVDLGVRWENGHFIKSGAALLDEGLVNDPLRWLRSSGYETVRTPFEKGLTHFLYATKRPEVLADVVTDMYESLEALAKIVTGRLDKDLSANPRSMPPTSTSNCCKDYIDYANSFRHAEREGQRRPELSPKEVESFVYLTGIFIRLALPAS